MPDMANMKIVGLQKLLTGLKKAQGRFDANKKPSVVMGYTAAYALFVHENTQMKLKGQPRSKPSKGRYWDPPGATSKYLEKPARQGARAIGDVVRKGTEKTKSLEKGLKLGGLLLQRMSQLLVPVDIGNLKASSFVAQERNVEAAAAAAFARAQKKR